MSDLRPQAIPPTPGVGTPAAERRSTEKMVSESEKPEVFVLEQFFRRYDANQIRNRIIKTILRTCSNGALFYYAFHSMCPTISPAYFSCLIAY